MGKNLTASVLENAPTFVTLHTNRGDVKIQLLATDAPKLSENFWRLAKDGKYDRTIFHRVIRGFMIQGGDFENSNGTGGTSYWGELLADEISPNLSHVRGAVSMANRGPDTNGSQFFIVHEDATFLDGRHSVFGNVIEGMDVVDKISDSKTDMNDFPLEPILITSVSFE
ncbi:peptidylprolyl isomerase [bacterium]|nr:peptidylprolyl isomerase [bacterium]MBT6831770.1 peptidylprolyl isomerase [bacterium]MBT6996593.1 peptidylprolyl isomerase [bacterium]MBT7772919.1 peptidylprolyl isomerase [bacterium]